MTLAEEGLPRGGRAGNEVFDHNTARGTINLLAEVDLRWVLEGCSRAHHRRAEDVRYMRCIWCCRGTLFERGRAASPAGSRALRPADHHQGPLKRRRVRRLVADAAAAPAVVGGARRGQALRSA
jgi:hypothetical protein